MKVFDVIKVFVFIVMFLLTCSLAHTVSEYGPLVVLGLVAIWFAYDQIKEEEYAE